ncbi:hypothetical protein A2999_01215 [Candidatus Wolfebacteria bacterium RIFCSPLOWO2_01_FULL_38_11]|uniref:Glycosyltransferase 2-like domain-containing protein n=1 Tax=Candidatus Wolfebacteria bacterium RIFCSPLOWO2_01_FULL_38_11 TaxID=1802556 RepID=A0A1F8DT32_9BACT|nr:MAG: hypothetical protein A2999_01215 [Candidatus Wolfebacteria bacterium RIFCSPLOWO2_01_FULL_38_11]
MLKSVDATNPDDVEIIICEDKSPKREEIRATVEKFKQETSYDVIYKENKLNLGFDKNLRELIKNAKGEWIIFMGDDDEFVPGALDKLVDFLRQNSDLGYVLRSYESVHLNGKIEKFRYYNDNRFFEPGLSALITLFRKSVFISGFTIRRAAVTDFLIDDFDGVLLFQLYLAAEVCLRYRAAYFDVVLTRQYEKELRPFFGTARAEENLYTPGAVTMKNSLNFLQGFFRIAEYLDKKYSFNSKALIKKEMSKYSYPALAIQRDKGIRNFLKYVIELNRLEFNITFYYHLYVIFLVLLGKRICDEGIRIIKNILGKTPEL